MNLQEEDFQDNVRIDLKKSRKLGVNTRGWVENRDRIIEEPWQIY